MYAGEAQRSGDGIEQKSSGWLFCSRLGSIYQALMQVLLTRQEINIQNMNVELVAQMFKNYRSNVLFHLEGKHPMGILCGRFDIANA